MTSRHGGGHGDSVLNMFGAASVAESTVNNSSARRSGQCFGSLFWSLSDSTSGQIGVGQNRSYSKDIFHPDEAAGAADAASSRGPLVDMESDYMESAEGEMSARRQSSSVADSGSDSTEKGLLEGLRPMRDRYLIAVLGRITAPIHQVGPAAASVCTCFHHISLTIIALLMRVISSDVSGA
jgi:hypothetical protein